MSRISRAAATGFSHHVTQRGNYQQRVFEDKDGFTGRMGGLLGQQPKTLSRGGLVRINKWSLSPSNS